VTRKRWRVIVVSPGKISAHNNMYRWSIL